MLELLWLLAAQAPAVAKQPSAEPPIELLEFLGDWSADEQRLLDLPVPAGDQNAGDSKQRHPTLPDASDEAPR